MILDSLSSSPRYETLGPRFARAFQWLRSVDPSTLAEGKTPIDGENLFVLAQHNQTKSMAKSNWEAHRRYADIQYVVSGRERMMWQSLSLAQPGEYVAEKDFLPLTAETYVDFQVPGGQFAVFFPEDAHKPAIEIPGAGPVFKLVMKILL